MSWHAEESEADELLELAQVGRALVLVAEDVDVERSCATLEVAVRLEDSCVLLLEEDDAVLVLAELDEELLLM